MTPLLKTLSERKTPLILAHRGSHQPEDIPENTLPAFREALELGADGFELDIRLSRDHRIVVFHDASLKRLIGRKGTIGHFTLKQLQTFPFLNSHFTPPIQIPTLEALFSQSPSGTYFNLEVKPPALFSNRTRYYRQLFDRLSELIRRFALQEVVWISSFDPYALWLWYRRRTGIPTALLFENWSPFTRLLTSRKYIDLLHPSAKLVDHYREFLSRQKLLCFWGVNERTTLQLMARWKVSAVITDRVSLAREVLQHD